MPDSIGMPNAGKSTFPQPRLGGAAQDRGLSPSPPWSRSLAWSKIDETDFVLADLPGLIEGAHEGVGLGDRFLGHAERCASILHLIDGTGDQIAKTYKTIRAELIAYGHGLEDKNEIVALNKVDAIPAAELAKKRAALEKACGHKVHVISGVSGEGINTVLRAMAKEINHRRLLRAERAESGPGRARSSHPRWSGRRSISRRRSYPRLRWHSDMKAAAKAKAGTPPAKAVPKAPNESRDGESLRENSR